jgi:hypothetical protein
MAKTVVNTGTEVIGNTIHGGNIIVRRRVDNMYPYLDRDSRAAAEAAISKTAKKLHPWAGKAGVKYVQGSDYYYYLSITMTVPATVRAAAVKERLEAAEKVRCPCGNHGSWDACVVGTSGGQPCVWAGCENCGSAVGRPILRKDLDWYERQ